MKIIKFRETKTHEKATFNRLCLSANFNIL